MITSTSNEKIKHVAALQQKVGLRREEGLFVAEGSRLFLEAPVSLVREVYVTERFLKNADTLLKQRLSETGYEEVSEPVFAKMSDTKSPQGILAVASQQSYSREELLAGIPLLLLLENIQDPGNLGTIFRTAEGAGVTGVILSPGCADIWQPKVVRSTMGSLFRVPFYRSEDLQREIAFLQNRGVCGILPGRQRLSDRKRGERPDEGDSDGSRHPRSHSDGRETGKPECRGIGGASRV